MTRRRSKLVAAIAAGAVAAGGIAVGALAATGGSGPDASGDLASAINQRAGTSLTAEQLRAAYIDVLRERLAAAVTAGRLTQEQADAMVARAQAGGLPIEPFRGRGGPGHGPRAEILAPVATLLRLSEEELRTQLRSGRTLTQVAAAQNVSKADLVAAIKTAIADSGRMGLTDAELTQLATRIADGAGPGPGRGRGPGGPGGFPGP